MATRGVIIGRRAPPSSAPPPEDDVDTGPTATWSSSASSVAYESAGGPSSSSHQAQPSSQLATGGSGIASGSKVFTLRSPPASRPPPSDSPHRPSPGRQIIASATKSPSAPVTRAVDSGGFSSWGSPPSSAPPPTTTSVGGPTYSSPPASSSAGAGTGTGTGTGWLSPSSDKYRMSPSSADSSPSSASSVTHRQTRSPLGGGGGGGSGGGGGRSESKEAPGSDPPRKQVLLAANSGLRAVPSAPAHPTIDPTVGRATDRSPLASSSTAGRRGWMDGEDGASSCRSRLSVLSGDGHGEVLALTEGQTLRRCVQKGWLYKKNDSSWRTSWSKRFFRVVVHTEVARVKPRPDSTAAELKSTGQLEEFIKAAWLLYYNDDGPAGEAKASIALDGMLARPTEDAKLSRKHPNCFEVAHPRRRTYYLRPLESDALLKRTQRSLHWMKCINAAIDTCGDLFTSKFRRAQQFGVSSGSTSSR